MIRDSIRAAGGKRALATRALLPLQIAVTGNRQFVRPLGAPVERLVFVCAGNICRSPFGEAVARDLGLSTTSMGLRAEAGVAANPAAVLHAQRLGVDMSRHQATPFEPALIRSTDLVLAFELWQALELRAALDSGSAQVRLLGGFVGLSNYHIHDPYGHGEDYFLNCFRTIIRGTKAIASLLENSRGK